MIIADSHVHSAFSSDSDTAPKIMVNKAIEQGKKIFYLTDHYDFDYPTQPDEDDFTIPMDQYFSTLYELKEKYAKHIDIRIGIELGLMAHISDKIEKFVKEFPFDFVIGSSHLVNGKDPYYPEYYAGRTDIEAYRDYFLSILDNVKTYQCYDVYGHLDYVVRYGPQKDKNYNPYDYEDIIREILNIIIYNGKGIEINTGSLYKGFGFPHPHETILKWYKELGGEIITIGSDAHKPEYFGYGFELAEALLKKNQFRFYTVFENGRPKQIPVQ